MALFVEVSLMQFGRHSRTECDRQQKGENVITLFIHSNIWQRNLIKCCHVRPQAKARPQGQRQVDSNVTLHKQVMALDI